MSPDQKQPPSEQDLEMFARFSMAFQGHTQGQIALKVSQAVAEKKKVPIGQIRNDDAFKQYQQARWACLTPQLGEAVPAEEVDQHTQAIVEDVLRTAFDRAQQIAAQAPITPLFGPQGPSIPRGKFRRAQTEQVSRIQGAQEARQTLRQEIAGQAARKFGVDLKNFGKK